MQKTLSLVLKKQNIGETDRILTIISPTLGKKRVIARAVRKPLSKMAGHLDTLMLSQLILTDDPDLPKVTSAQLIQPFEQVRNHLARSTQAQAVSRLVERVILEDVGSRPIFQLTVQALNRLNDDVGWSAVWLKFLFELAGSLGVRPEIDSCRRCGQPLVGDSSYVLLERCFYCQDCIRLEQAARLTEKNAVKLLQLLQHRPFTMIERITIPEPIAWQVEEILLEEITQWLNKPWQNYAGLARG